MVLAAAACMLFLAGTFRANRHISASIALGTLVAGLILHCLTAGLQLTSLDADVARATLFNGPLARDGLAALVRLIALGGGVVFVLFSWNEVSDRQASDYFACL